jgi:hypothetical protein
VTSSQNSEALAKNTSHENDARSYIKKTHFIPQEPFVTTRTLVDGSLHSETLVDPDVMHAAGCTTGGKVQRFCATLHGMVSISNEP